MNPVRSRLAAPLAISLLCAAVYVAMLGPRVTETSPNNHYAHLANSFLHGQLHQLGDPAGTNDWACIDRETLAPCPNGVFHFDDAARYRWYVSFPPFPAIVMLPAVAAFGVAMKDRLFWALVAGLGPGALYALLRHARGLGVSRRSAREDLALTFLFAFGTVFFFVAEQGTVWFAAHVTSVPLLCLFLGASLEARRPLVAGLTIGALFLTRPTTALFGLFFVFEALRVAAGDTPPGWMTYVRSIAWREALRKLAPFALGASVGLVAALAFNHARFSDPMVFGHEYLQVIWRGRIEKWGLFNYHYVARNLAIFLAGLPWLSREAPHFVVSGHGLALWVTTPHLLTVFFPRERTSQLVTLGIPLLLVVVMNLMYQNSGWVQFGYRFALDYLPAVFLLLALGGRRFGRVFALLALFALALNTFGALTFDRAPQFYHVEGTQTVLFQPD